MSITLNANQVPGVQIAASPPTRTAAAASMNGTATSTKNISQGESGELVSRWNENAQILEDAFLFGGGRIRAILEGLALTVSGGATGTVTVAAGRALIDGFVEYAGGNTILGTGTGTKFVWLQKLSGGALSVTVLSSSSAVPSDLTPGAVGVYLGAVLSSGTVDTSGVVYESGDGGRIRSTADNNVPTDTPPNGIKILTFTQGGAYVWDGFFTHQWQIAGTAGTAIYFGNMPHSSTDPTTHDNSSANGKHVMPPDRTAWDMAAARAQVASLSDHADTLTVLTTSTTITPTASSPNTYWINAAGLTITVNAGGSDAIGKELIFVNGTWGTAQTATIICATGGQITLTDGGDSTSVLILRYPTPTPENRALIRA